MTDDRRVTVQRNGVAKGGTAAARSEVILKIPGIVTVKDESPPLTRTFTGRTDQSAIARERDIVTELVTTGTAAVHQLSLLLPCTIGVTLKHIGRARVRINLRVTDECRVTFKRYRPPEAVAVDQIVGNEFGLFLPNLAVFNEDIGGTTVRRFVAIISVAGTHECRVAINRDIKAKAITGLAVPSDDLQRVANNSAFTRVRRGERPTRDLLSSNSSCHKEYPNDKQHTATGSIYLVKQYVHGISRNSSSDLLKTAMTATQWILNNRNAI